MQHKIKLLIVDDSALMRRHLAAIFEEEGDFELRFARNGLEAVRENRDFCPDVVTLDVNMPEMDGLTALTLMMSERPVPVLMVSSLTERGALVTLEALQLGAVDFVAKPGGTISLRIDAIREEMVKKVRSATRTRLKVSAARNLSQRIKEERDKDARERKASRALRASGDSPGVVAIGVSTGGPRTLEDVLPHLPVDFPWPVVIAQHMPQAFTRPFAERMNGLCALTVVEVTEPMSLDAGTIYIGRGGADVVVGQRGGKRVVFPRPESKEHLWHPSVELLGRSVLEHVEPTRIIGIMLTGMGGDGAEAFAEIRRRGGKTIAESEESAVVFGMPAELIKRGGASVILDAPQIPAQLRTWVMR